MTILVPSYISLGSNLGNPEINLDRARRALNRLEDAQLKQCSPVYRCNPQDVREQSWFANQVLRLDCGPSWTAEGLLQALLDIESAMGRMRLQEKGPRIIDLDLLLFGSECLNTPKLTLPHPRMRNRAFVLVPLLDIAPDLVFPDGISVSDTLQVVTYQVHGSIIQQP